MYNVLLIEFIQIVTSIVNNLFFPTMTISSPNLLTAGLNMEIETCIT